jgi:hypothetical protein
MRTITFLALLISPSVALLAHKDRVEPPRALTVAFKTGETATFALSDGKIVAVTLHVGDSDSSVPKGECAKLRDVRFETVSLLWNGSHESAAKANYFYLTFDMGAEQARAFGELPSVHLMFRDGKFAEATVTKKTAEDTWQHSKL